MLVSSVITQGRVSFAYALDAAADSVTAAVGEDAGLTYAASAKGIEIIILSSYKETMKIGQSRILIAASTGAFRCPMWAAALADSGLAVAMVLYDTLRGQFFIVNR